MALAFCKLLKVKEVSKVWALKKFPSQSEGFKSFSHLKTENKLYKLYGYVQPRACKCVSVLDFVDAHLMKNYPNVLKNWNIDGAVKS